MMAQSQSYFHVRKHNFTASNQVIVKVYNPHHLPSSEKNIFRQMKPRVPEHWEESMEDDTNSS